MERRIAPAALLLFPLLMQAQNAAFSLIVEGAPNGSSFPVRFTCDAPGGGVSPALRWSGEPAGTQSFALIMDDPDSRDFVHWLKKHVPAKAEYHLRFGH